MFKVPIHIFLVKHCVGQRKIGATKLNEMAWEHCLSLGDVTFTLGELDTTESRP